MDIQSACEAVADDGLIPGLFVIDGCDAERVAIRTVFPTTPMRACQLRVMQAVKSMVRKLFGRHSERDKPVATLLQAFRRCQRCPTSGEGAASQQFFLEEVIGLTKGVREVASRKAFFKYLDKEWFSDRWRTFVNYGFPSSIIASPLVILETDHGQCIFAARLIDGASAYRIP